MGCVCLCVICGCFFVFVNGLFVSVGGCVFVGICVCTCVSVCVYICVCLCPYVFLYVYICVHMRWIHASIDISFFVCVCT